jgi:hypothetical protein
MKSGTIIYDTKFQFADGSTLDKLIIIVAELGNDFLAVKTTTRQRHMNNTSGCQINDKPPNFYIPAHASWFNKDTWVELDEIFEIDSTLLNIKLRDRVAAKRGAVSDDLLKQILDCALQSQDIEQYYMEFLRRKRNGLT